MKVDLKKKVMLALLAGGMLCADSVFAYSDPTWYGFNNGSGVVWKSVDSSTINDACVTGANLTLSGTETCISDTAPIPFADVTKFHAGYSETGNVTNNVLTICGGNYADGTQISGGYSVNGDAINNTINIFGGTFGAVSIAAGYANYVSGTASGNILNIENGTFNSDGYLINGGFTTNSSTGNILNLKIKMSGTAQQVSNFQEFNFTLPADILDGTATMIKTDKLIVDISGSVAQVNVYAANGVTLHVGDKITLIDVTTTGLTTGTFMSGSDGILCGAAILYDEQTLGEDKNEDGDTKDLVITLLRDFITGGSENQQKAPVEGIAAAMATVNQSADLASGKGMESLLSVTEGGNVDTFAAASGGHSKYKTGSHIDVNGWGMLAGVGKTNELENGGATTYGLFFEYGKGDFDTYNGDVHGDGDTNNKGVGIMIRHRMKNNTYFEGNVRYGKQETKWSESEIGSYDTDSKYYGAMIGIGHIYKKGNNKLDTYLRYAYGHVGACDATLKDGSDYHFESIKSHRLRTGVRYTFGQQAKGFKPYIGAAWEHEFNGEAKASISGIGEAPAPTLQGNTGIFELGFDWDADTKWVFGMNANAYIGKRKGWDGMARVFYNF